MFLFLSLFRWRVARYDGVAVSPRLPLAARRRRWDHCHGHGTKKAKEGRLCVCEKTGPPPARVGFRFPPTDNFEKKKKKKTFSPGVSWLVSRGTVATVIQPSATLRSSTGSHLTLLRPR